MRRLVAMVVLALITTACNDDGGEDAASTTTTEAADSTTSTASDGTTTTTEPVPFDVEVKRAAIDLLEIRNDVFQNPDVSRVSDYIADTCVCLERERGIVDGLVRDGLSWSGPAAVALGARVANPEPSGPTIVVVAEQPAANLVDASGSPVESVAAVARAVYFVNLAPTGAAWRINGLDPGASLGPDVVEQIVQEGLP